MNAMLWMRGLTLGCVGLLAGCLQAESVHCANGVVCPGGTRCAESPVFCAAPAQVEACLDKNIPDFGRCEYSSESVGACRGGACFECLDNELAGCEHTGWFPMVSNTTVSLRGVWTGGPSDAFAVGGNTIAHYDGFEWRAQIFPGVELTAVWGSDLDHVFATTAGGAIYQHIEDGTKDGTWSVVHNAGFALHAIGGSGPDDVIALNPLGNRIVRSDGAGWRVETIPTTERLYGLAVRSRDDVFLAGTRGVIHRSAGSTWPTSRVAMVGQANLAAIAATPTAVFAIGEGDATTTSAVRLPDGQSTWISEVVSGVSDTFFNAIWAADDEAFAVAVSGRIVSFAGAWKVVESGTNADLYAIHGSDHTNVFAVGAAGTILRYVGP